MLRLALLPLVFMSERIVNHPEAHSTGFEGTLVCSAVYASAVLIVRVRPDARAPAWLDRVEPVVDLVLLCALTYTSGGAFSQTRYAFFALPVLAALRLRPVLAAVWAAAAVVGYVALALPHPATRGREATEVVLSHAGYLVWLGAAAVLLSGALARRSSRIARLAAERGRLVAQSLDAEQRERRRLAELLHDETVQTLLLARHELTDARRGRDGAFERTDAALQQAVAQLRGEIFDLHPYVLDHAGLAAALEAVAAQHRRRTPARIEVRVDPEAPGHHDEIIVSVARELLNNAARHAGAGRIDVVVAREGPATLIEVADDGCGFTDDRRMDAIAEGHIGLATSAARVRALGGEFVIESVPGEGSHVRALVPDRVPAEVHASG